jgi:hypothetical protein
MEVRIGSRGWTVGFSILCDESAADREESALMRWLSPAASKAVSRSPLGCWSARREETSDRDGREVAAIRRSQCRACRRGRCGAQSADGGDGGIDSGGIDGGRFVSCETEKYGAIRGVAQTGEGQRTVKIVCTRATRSRIPRDPVPAQSGRPRASAHGMRTGGTHADLVEIEKARRHGSDCSEQQGPGSSQQGVGAIPGIRGRTRLWNESARGESRRRSDVPR